MLLIQKLRRPNKRSGHKLEPGEKTKVRGVVLVNTNSHAIFVDKWSRKARRKK